MAAALQQTSFDFIQTSQKSESNVTVTLEAKGLLPGKSCQDVKHGEVDVSFLKQGFEAFFKDEKANLLWKYTAIRLPTPIEPEQCSWKVEIGQILVFLVKKKERGPDGSEYYINWSSMLKAKGLDQYDSSEDEDGNVPDPGAIRFKSEDLPFEVEQGRDNVFEVTSDFRL